MVRSPQLQVMPLMLGLVLIANYEGVPKGEKIMDPELLEDLGAQGMAMFPYQCNLPLAPLKRKRSQKRKKIRKRYRY